MVFWGSSISSKKGTNKFDLTTMIPQVDLFSYVFWRKSTTPKTISKLTDLQFSKSSFCHFLSFLIIFRGLWDLLDVVMIQKKKSYLVDFFDDFLWKIFGCFTHFCCFDSASFRIEQGLLNLDGRNSQKYLHQTEADFLTLIMLHKLTQIFPGMSYLQPFFLD